MGFSIFPFFYHGKVTFAAFRTCIVFTVVLIHLQFCRDKNQFAADKLFSDLFQCSIADWTDFLPVSKIQIFLLDRDPFETLCICSPGFPFLSCFIWNGRLQFFCLGCSRVLFHFCFIEKVQLTRDIKSTFLAGRAKEFFTQKSHFVFQVVPFLCQGFFPFIGSIDSCLKCFYHLFEIVYHVLQLTELDIFGTVCHCFFLLFLLSSLYQKTREFPSKTGTFID